MTERSTVSPDRTIDIGERIDFVIRHAGEENCHEKCGHLIVRNLAASIRINQIRDLLRVQFFAVAFAVNQVDCAHYCNPAYHLKSLKVKKLAAITRKYGICGEPHATSPPGEILLP